MFDDLFGATLFNRVYADAWFPTKKFQLLYKATRDGLHQESFARACHNKGPTLCFIKVGRGEGRGGRGKEEREFQVRPRFRFVFSSLLLLNTHIFSRAWEGRSSEDTTPCPGDPRTRTCTTRADSSSSTTAPTSSSSPSSQGRPTSSTRPTSCSYSETPRLRWRPIRSAELRRGTSSRRRTRARSGCATASWTFVRPTSTWVTSRCSWSSVRRSSRE